MSRESLIRELFFEGQVASRSRGGGKPGVLAERKQFA
jgi:hypothetical protein